jgi:hypothetical protein
MYVSLAETVALAVAVGVTGSTALKTQTATSLADVAGGVFLLIVVITRATTVVLTIAAGVVGDVGGVVAAVGPAGTQLSGRTVVDTVASGLIGLALLDVDRAAAHEQRLVDRTRHSGGRSGAHA